MYKHIWEFFLKKWIFSGALPKCAAAFRTGDLNLSLSSGHTYLLAALWAFENPIHLCLVDHTPVAFKKCLYLCFGTLICHSFRIPFLYVPGKHTEIQINQQNPANII